MKNKVLITGGAGFIGSKLSLALLARGHEVRVLDNLAPQIHGANPESSKLFQSIRGKVDFRRGDVTKRDDLLGALAGVDILVHLAAETGTGQSMYAISHYSDVNIGGTALLLDLVANQPFPLMKIVIASSRAIYGEGRYQCSAHGPVYPGPRNAQRMERGDFEVHCPLCERALAMLPTDESSPVQPSSVYGITKLCQEQMVLTVCRSLGISALALRYQNVYGPGQSMSNPYTGILSIFSTRIRTGKDINIFEDGRESRDFVYVDDAVAATVAGVEYPDPIVDALNVGSGLPTDVLSVAEMLQKCFGQSVPTRISGQFRIGDIRHCVADLAHVKKTLGFAPAVTIEEGLRRLCVWAREEEIGSDRYEESLAELRAKGLFR